MKDLLTLSASELVANFRKRTLSPVEVMDAVLHQTEKAEATINAFVVRAADEALRQLAVESEERWLKGESVGELDGVPVVVKDAILVRGWPNRAGSLISSSQPCREDAPAPARVREAGAILLGKTTTPEFGWKGVTDSPLTGVTKNPWNTQLTPGGSSGGSAAAVAAGMAHLAVGTDAAGSVRIPAAFCGLVALKATRGRVPAYPPSAVWTLGHIGPITRSVEDAALMMDVMTRPDFRDWNALPEDGASYVSSLGKSLSVGGLKVAYSPTLGYAEVEPEVAAAVERVAHRLSDLGARVEELEAPLPDSRMHFRTYFESALVHSLSGYNEEERRYLDSGLAALIDRARGITREQFLDAYDFQIRLTRESRLFHRNYDLLLTPTVAVAPFATGTCSPPGYDPDNWLDWSPFTIPFNLTGQPALSLPCGHTAAGLPIGAQFVGPLYSDLQLLRIAHLLEQSGLSERHLPALLDTPQTYRQSYTL